MKQQHADKFTDEELISAYKETPQLSILAVRFDVPDITIFRRAQRLGLVFKTGGFNKGQAIKYELSDILNGMHPQYQTNKLKGRLIEEKVKENRCEECSITSWNGKALTLHLDHIDGDCHNHRLVNLRLLCPNCHSQTVTYCGKNK
jgi:hypothetical protein